MIQRRLKDEGLNGARNGAVIVRGGQFHVLGRGLERRKLFNSDEDKADFLLRLDVGLKKSGHACYVWAYRFWPPAHMEKCLF